MGRNKLRHGQNHSGLRGLRVYCFSMESLRISFVIMVTVVLGGWLVRGLVIALRKGVANAAGTLHTRSNNPVMFWLTIFVQCFFALACLLVLLRTILRNF